MSTQKSPAMRDGGECMGMGARAALQPRSDRSGAAAMPMLERGRKLST